MTCYHHVFQAIALWYQICNSLKKFIMCIIIICNNFQCKTKMLLLCRFWEIFYSSAFCFLEIRYVMYRIYLNNDTFQYAKKLTSHLKVLFNFNHVMYNMIWCKRLILQYLAKWEIYRVWHFDKSFQPADHAYN